MSSHAFGISTTASSAPPLTLPTTNLIAAWDARVGVTDVSGACSAWADQSGNGYHAVQTISGRRPAISSTGGTPSLLFDGSDDNMEITLGVGAGAKTVYFVVNPSADASPRTILGNAIGMVGIGALNGTYQGNDGSGWRNTTVSYTSGRQRLCYQMQSSDGLSFWKNGTPATPVGTWVSNPAFTGTQFIGAAWATWWSYLGHVLFIGIYSGTRNTAVEDYITQEWGV